MVIDVFLFNGETKLLELRLNYLKDVVDKFIIIESGTTFSGEEKPLHATIILQEKILNLPYGKMSVSIAKNMPFGEDRWQREFHMRNHCRIALLENNTQDEDYIIFGDIDEIPRKEIIPEREIGICNMDSYHYFLNLHERLVVWPGSALTLWERFKIHSSQGIRENRHVMPRIPNAGWHFTFMGGEEGLRSKLMNYSHIELSNEPQVQTLLANSKNPDPVRFEKVEMTTDTHPDYLVNNINLFKEMIC